MDISRVVGCPRGGLERARLHLALSAIPDLRAAVRGGPHLQSEKGGPEGPPFDYFRLLVEDQSPGALSVYQVPPEQPPELAGAQVYGFTSLPAVFVMVNVWFAPPESAFDVATIV